MSAFIMHISNCPFALIHISNYKYMQVTIVLVMPCISQLGKIEPPQISV